VLVTKSPASGGFLDTYSSGRVTPEDERRRLRWADHHGRASHPVFLLIEDDKVELRDAAPFWQRVL